MQQYHVFHCATDAKISAERTFTAGNDAAAISLAREIIELHSGIGR